MTIQALWAKHAPSWWPTLPSIAAWALRRRRRSRPIGNGEHGGTGEQTLTSAVGTNATIWI